MTKDIPVCRTVPQHLMTRQESRPSVTKHQWLALISVTSDAEVDPTLWERPGEYLGAKVLMYLDPTLRARLCLGEEFETRICLLSPAEGWAVVRDCAAFWQRPDPSVSLEQFIDSLGPA